MEWSTVTALFGGIIMVLTFIWGIVKTFKKTPSPETSQEDVKEWKIPLTDLKNKLEEKWTVISKDIAELKTKIGQLENAESYDKKDMEELKQNIKNLEERFEKKIEALTGKQDKMLERFIEFLQQQ